MTCYLTDTIDAREVELGLAEGVFTACDLYPADATTNSDHGVTDVRKIKLNRPVRLPPTPPSWELNTDVEEFTGRLRSAPG
jgi:hypothetical protein